MKKNKKQGKPQSKQKRSPFYGWICDNLLVLIPFLLISLSWFLSGDPARKWNMLLWSKREVAEGQQILSGFWQNMMFYPKAVMNDYVFSPWLGILVVASLFIPLAVYRYHKIDKLYIIVWVSLLLSIFAIGNKMNRLIYIIAPFIFMIFAGTLCYFMDLVVKRKDKRKLIGALLLAAVFIPVAFSLPRVPRMLSGDIRGISHGVYVRKGPENLVDVLEFFRENVPQDEPFSSAVSMGSMCPYVFYFYFHDWRAPFFTRFQASDRRFYQSKYYLAVDLDEDSPYFDSVMEDSVNTWNAFLDLNLAQGKLAFLREKKFDTIGVTAKIYTLKRDR